MKKLYALLLLVLFFCNADAQWESIGPNDSTSVTTILTTGDIFCAQTTEGYYSSQNSGETWADLTEEFAGIGLPGAISFYSFNNKIYASSLFMFTSTDGANWTYTSGPPGTTDFVHKDNSLFAAAYGEVARTEDGVEWSDFSSGLPIEFYTGIAELDGNLFAIKSNGGGSNTELYKTPVTSPAWEVMNDEFPYDTSLISANPSVTCLATAWHLLFAGTTGGVFKSVGGFPEWNAIGTGLETTKINDLLYNWSTLIAATDSGIFFLPGWDGPWINATTNIPVSRITKLAVNGDYLYVATDGAGIWKISNSALGIKNTKSNNATIQLFPNPAAEQFTISNAENKLIKSVSVIDLSGRSVYSKLISQHISSINIPVAGLSKGIYFVEIGAESGIEIRKIVVN